MLAYKGSIVCLLSFSIKRFCIVYGNKPLIVRRYSEPLASWSVLIIKCYETKVCFVSVPLTATYLIE